MPTEQFSVYLSKISDGLLKGEFMVKIHPSYSVKHTPAKLNGSVFRCLPDDTLDLFTGHRDQDSLKAV